jgi:hexosaminidase
MESTAYEWRGLSVDVVRHFFGVEDVIRVMDMASHFGLNRLHLHLSDDQGWRLDIPGWPQLVERSSQGSVGGDPGGFYDADDWRRIRDAARSRGLTLVPEFDMPGHTNAALHAIPGLNPDGVCPPPYEGVEVGFSSLRVAAPDTERFVRDVFTYLTDVSDGWVHVGGDESHSTEHDEYAELVDMTMSAVRDAGGSVVAWQEAAPFLQLGEHVQVWDERLPSESIVAAARRGVKVILSPASRVYLDMKYDEGTELGTTWMGTTELTRTADWHPHGTIAGLPTEAIAGVEACIWTETMRTFDDLSYMLLPRLAAAADIARYGSIDWEEFAAGLPARAREWRKYGWVWHRSPGIDWDAG